MKISIFGLGYVGTVSAACLAHLGHKVIGTDVNLQKIESVRAGRPPVLEPKLDSLLAEGVASGRIRATMDARDAVCKSDISFVCVGTPSRRDGSLDAQYLFSVVDEIAAACRKKGKYHAVVVRSTAQPEIHRELRARLESAGLRAGEDVSYVVHPEFLREGSGIDDFFRPPKIVFGCEDERARLLLEKLYPRIDAQVFFVRPDDAAMVKYADNLFHAIKITFANEVGQLCHALGADCQRVMDIFCSDTKLNISDKYLRPGMPFGGSCLPKDLRAMTSFASSRCLSLPLMGSVLASNQRQIENMIEDLLALGKQKYLLVGLSFKPQTDDVRESPLIAIAERLVGKGKQLRAFDRGLSVERLVGSNRSFALGSIPHLAGLLVDDLRAAAAEAEVIVVGSPLDEVDARAVADSEAEIVDLVRAFRSPDLPPRLRALYA
jgi:GDP-mannose 6-dehydrogenase